jgi:hypothetical protein
MVYHQPSIGFWWFYFQVELLNPPHFTAPAPPAPASSRTQNRPQRPTIAGHARGIPKANTQGVTASPGMASPWRNRGIPCPGGWNISWMIDDIDKAECKWCMKITPNWWISNYIVDKPICICWNWWSLFLLGRSLAGGVKKPVQLISSAYRWRLDDARGYPPMTKRKPKHTHNTVDIFKTVMDQHWLHWG